MERLKFENVKIRLYAPAYFLPVSIVIIVYCPPLRRTVPAINTSSAYWHIVITAAIKNATGTERPVMAIAAPNSVIIPAPMICPTDAPIKSQKPRHCFNCFVELPLHSAIFLSFFSSVPPFS